MNKVTSVQEYLDKNQKWQAELILLRETLIGTELNEEIKWGAPIYTLGGKNIVGIGAFKSYVGLWFHNGVFLKDPKKKLINAQKGTTKGLRQWRFMNVGEIDQKLILQYVNEAIANQKAGKEIKAVKAKNVSMPIELKTALKENAILKNKYDQLTPGRQREYAEYIGAAKQENTRMSRLEKVIPMIIEGKGLNDKYK